MCSATAHAQNVQIARRQVQRIELQKAALRKENQSLRRKERLFELHRCERQTKKVLRDRGQGLGLEM